MASVMSAPAIPRSIGKQVGASATDDEETYGIDAAATLRDLSLRIYAGAELDLEITVWIDPEEGARYPLIQLEGKDALDGDDDTWEWASAEVPVDDGDELLILADNNDGTNAYDYRFNWTEDRLGGAERVVSGLRSLVGRVA